MRRLRKKAANASTVDKAPAPENDATAVSETAVVVVSTEVITETVESEVVSQIEYHNDTTNGEKQIKDDAVDAPADGVNELKQSASGEEANEEIVTDGGVEGGEEGGDGIDDVDLYRASGGDGNLAVNNADGGEDEDKDVDHDVEGDMEGDNEVEDEDEENENAHDNNELENENEEEDEEMENENEEEEEEMENENVEEEDVEDLKAANDEGGQVNIGKEEVKEDNTEKEGVEKVNLGKEEVKEDNTVKEGVEKVNIGKVEIKEDNTKKAGVKRQRGRLQKKGNPAGDTNGEKKISGGSSGQADITTEHRGGQSNPEAVKAEEKIEGAEGGSSNKKRNKPKKKKKKNVEGGPNKEAATKQEDNQELPPKGKPNKAKSMGMIFMCNTKTKNDCFRYKVFGLPSGKRETVEKIYKGMRLFLYDVDLKLLYGIYKAAAPGGYNVQPKAFNSKYPSQVQFTVLGDCPPLPEEKFKKVLQDNYYTKKKFNTILTPKQVKDLCTLFNSNKHHGDSQKLDKKSVKRKPRDRVESPRYPRYERERGRAVITPPVRAPARLAPLPRAAPPPYVYDRALEDRYRQPVLTRRDVDYRQPVLTRRDVDYRQPVLTRRDVDYRQPVITHRDDYRITGRDDYRQQPVLTRRDDYRQQALLLEDPYSREDRVVVQRHELRPLDEYRRADPVIHYRGGSGGYATTREDVAIVDPYSSTSYRERADTNGGVYAERDDGAASVLPEYRSVRPRYQYY